MLLNFANNSVASEYNIHIYLFIATSDDTHLSERQVVMTRLLDAVKQV